MKHPFSPNRMTKGNCTACKHPIEKYESVYFAFNDPEHEYILHYECARDINYEIIQDSKKGSL